MRVLSVIESLLHGGAETVLVDLVRGLRQHDHRVLHFTSAHGGVIHPWIRAALEDASIPCLDAHWRQMQHAAERIEVLGDFAPDVVVYHWWGQNTLLPWITDVRAAASQSRPVFVTVMHNGRKVAPSGFDVYVLVTETQRPQVADIEPRRVHVIPNGVDLKRFPPQASTALARPFTIGRISSLRPGKIPEDWVRTAAAYDLASDTRFVIAGDGQLRGALQQQASDLGAVGRFSFPGYVNRDDVPAMLATFDVLCHVTSHAAECHPLALLEAAAAGLPIVGEARGGVPDIVHDDENGLLATTSAEVGEKLRRLEQDVDLRRRLSEGARRVAERFAIEHQIAAYSRLLRAVNGGALDDARAAPAEGRNDVENTLGLKLP